MDESKNMIGVMSHFVEVLGGNVQHALYQRDEARRWARYCYRKWQEAESKHPNLMGRYRASHKAAVEYLNRAEAAEAEVARLRVLLDLDPGAKSIVLGLMRGLMGDTDDQYDRLNAALDDAFRKLREPASPEVEQMGDSGVGEG